MDAALGRSQGCQVKDTSGQGAAERRPDRAEAYTDVKTRLRLLVLLGPPALMLLVCFVLPMVNMGLVSFRQGSFGAERNIWTLEHYRAFAANADFHRLLLHSTWIALLTAVVTVLLAYPVAYYLAFHAGRRRTTLLMLLLVPAWTSFLLRILAWKLILGSEGLLSVALQALGVLHEPRPLLLYTSTAVVVALVYSWLPFVAMPIYSTLDRLDQRLLEAASDLGCTPSKAFLRVTLPLSIPGVVSGFFYVFIPTLGEWVTPALVGGVDGVMYGNIIQDQFGRALNWPMGSLMSLVMLVAVLLLLGVFAWVARALHIDLGAA